MYRRAIARSLMVAIIAAGTLLAGQVPADDLGRGISVDDWQGFGVLKGGKGYVQTPMGQLHYRDIGPRDYKYPIVLLHQSPMSMIQWAGVQNALDKMGIRTITVDTPGYGLSDPPPKQPSIQDFADNIVPLLDHLNLDRVVIGGHHTGAHIAVSFAANHGDRVVGLVLHGAAQMTAEEASAYLSNPNRKPRTPLPNGSHLTRAFNSDKIEPQEILDAKTWLTIGVFIQGPDIGHWAAFHYDMLPDLPKIHVPTLLLSDTEDPVNVMDKRLAGLRPDFKYVEFSDGNLFEFMAEPQRWAKIVADWKTANVK
jgi:pimeloyl-ACP methyl ester carboxylesterase